MIELEEIDEPLNREEFLDAVNRLYESTVPPNKEVLMLKHLKTEVQDSNLTFNVSWDFLLTFI